MRCFFYIGLAVLILGMAGCSTKKNNFFTRQYHRLATRYNVYFNGNEALKAGEKKMERNHKEDYTNLLPVFVSNNEQTRALCSGDMDYAVEKAVKAIDKHSITAKPKRRKNKDSKNYENFRKKKEFNDQIAQCYLLLGKAYFYKKKYTIANNTFRYIQRQYPEDKNLMTEVQLWLFRSLTEMGRYDEAAPLTAALDGARLRRSQREIYAAARTDFYVRQTLYSEAIPAAENLVKECKSMKRKPRYNFMLSQLYLKEHQDAQALAALKKAVRFNFNYEMVFNAKINMALAYQSGDEGVRKKLEKMLRDSRNEEYQDRIYYALASIEEKQGNQEGAVELYWKSVRSSVDNDNQKSLSFLKLGDYYYQRKDYVPAHSCYDSCMYFMDSRVEGYEQLKTLVGNLTDLVTQLNTIQQQDSLQQLAAMPEAQRNAVIDSIIQEIKDETRRQQELERQAQLERNFYQRNDMLSRNNAFNQTAGSGGDWYFYNPMTVSLGKNDFKRKWGRRKLEDNWRRQNKAMVDFADESGLLAEEKEQGGEKPDVTSRDYYLKNIPLTEEQLAASEKKIEEAYYRAGELYLYTFQDPEKALACFQAFIRRFPESNNITLGYYLAYDAAVKAKQTTEAESLKNDLIRKFPESDFSRALQDPEYFRKVDYDLQQVDRMYAEAYDLYQRVYYNEALVRCEDILKKYPENKRMAHVLFLRAMCMVNLRPVEESRVALNEVLEAKPDKNIRTVVNGILASLDVGDKPVLYADAEMADARYLQSVRNWVFDEEGKPEEKEGDRENPYRADKTGEYAVFILLPEEMKTMQLLQLQSRLAFIHAALNAGKKAKETREYETKKEDLWYKATALKISPFEGYEEAETYLNRIGTDKVLLKNFRGKRYRIFAISGANFDVLKRLKDEEQYVDFFIGNYFSDRGQGEILTGRQGAAAHLFRYEDTDKHNFVLMVPYRQVNVKKLAELLHGLEPAFAIEKATYDDEYEMIVVKNVGTQGQSMEYLELVARSQDIFERISRIPARQFTITPGNLEILLENQNIEEYMKFFEDNYRKNRSGEVGVADGDFVYAKNVAHKFLLFYPNTIDPFKLKAAFEEFNFSGLSVNNLRYDDTHDCLVVSGFNNKEAAMRYFHNAVGNRKLFKALRAVDYRNFVISDSNLETMQEKMEVEKYLVFFKKYYLE